MLCLLVGCWFDLFMMAPLKLVVPLLLVLGASRVAALEPSNINRRNFVQKSISTASMIGFASAYSLQSPANAYYMPPSIQDKTILITGGNTGLGLESAKRLAAAGANVIVTTRTDAKGQQAVKDIQEYTQNNSGTVSYQTLDLCDLSQVKECAKSLVSTGKKFDVLMNNAGVMALPELELTKDGYERTFQTNHLGHFVLTSILMGSLADKARIINVSSEAYKFADKGLELDNLNSEKSFGPWKSYGTSKLSNILFTKELQRRIDESGKSITANSLHPGAVATDLGRYLVGEEKWNRMKQEGMTFQEQLLFVPLSKFTKTVADGASTQIFLAADSSLDTNPSRGEYFIDCKVNKPWDTALDMEKARALWEASESMAGIKFTV